MLVDAQKLSSMGSFPAFVPHLGPDGIPTDVPLIAYTEKVLEEKEQQLRKYIQDNYSKIRNVERELSSLALEVKLTAGPKKAALEHLQRKIELSTEKIKVAKQKEEQAKKIWEATVQILREEEEVKQRLCDDLNRLVQESAAAQYARLEELKQRLEALNPEHGGGASLTTNPEAENGTKLSDSEQETGNNLEQIEGTGIPELNGKPDHESASGQGKDALIRSESGSHRQALGNGGTGRSSSQGHKVTLSKGRGKAKPSLVNQRLKGNTWTGAGFDVDDTGFTG